MFKVEFKDLEGNLIGKGEFLTEQDANSWLAKQLAKSFYCGKKAKRVIVDEGESPVSYSLEDVLESYPEEVSEEALDSEGNPLVTQPAKVLLRAEYVYEGPTDISAQKMQEDINAENQKFLDETDWKVIRHRDQKAAIVPTSISDAEYQQLLLERQAARDAIVK